MITRISKIARLPITIRNELNERLHNGHFGRDILPWLNNLPETKEILAENFEGKPITHQNLSEWRRAGYQDWLLHQQRIDWFEHFTENEEELKQYDGCCDTYEAMSRYFVFEIGQAMRAMQQIKNPAERWARLETLNREFCRLQNSYNWSRRVGLEYDKHNGPEEPEIVARASCPCEPHRPDARATTETPAELPPAPQIEKLPATADEKNGDRARLGRSETRPRVSPLRAQSSESVTPPIANEPPNVAQPSRLRVQESSRLQSQDAPRTSEAEDQRVSPAMAGDCGSPLPLSEANSPTPKPLNSQTPPAFHAITTPEPTPQPGYPAIPQPIPQRTIDQTNSIQKSRNLYTRTRGRGFTCIEG